VSQDSQKNNKVTSNMYIGPCGEHNCPVCVFTKSQAPGNPYDLKDCPKYNSGKAEETKKNEE